MTLLYDILSDDNIQKALETITNKSDVPGPDGLRPSQLGEYWESNSSAIIDMILSGEYEPTAVKQFEQLNKRGKKRKVTQMCMVDKLLARAQKAKVRVYLEKLSVCLMSMICQLIIRKVGCLLQRRDHV